MSYVAFGQYVFYSSNLYQFSPSLPPSLSFLPSSVPPSLPSIYLLKKLGHLLCTIFHNSGFGWLFRQGSFKISTSKYTYTSAKSFALRTVHCWLLWEWFRSLLPWCWLSDFWLECFAFSNVLRQRQAHFLFTWRKDWLYYIYAESVLLHRVVVSYFIFVIPHSITIWGVIQMFTQIKNLKIMYEGMKSKSNTKVGTINATLQISLWTERWAPRCFVQDTIGPSVWLQYVNGSTVCSLLYDKAHNSVWLREGVNN